MPHEIAYWLRIDYRNPSAQFYRMKTAFLMIPVLLLAACAQVTATRGSSFTDPAFTGGGFSSLVIDARAGSLTEREAIERSAVAEAQRIGIPATASIDVLPPTRDTGEQARKRKIMNTGAAVVLEIHPREKQIVRDYIPGSRYRNSPWHHRGWRHGRHGYDDPFFYDEPSLILEEPESHYEAILFTLPHYRKAWAGDLTTRGPTGMSFDDVAANYGRELVERLAADGMLATSLR
ncbi:MAG: hypothetical protein IPJ01_01560 [Micavibrio sp.]|nr:hypothetical protein [Micavibrio sp.]